MSSRHPFESGRPARHCRSLPCLLVKVRLQVLQPPQSPQWLIALGAVAAGLRTAEILGWAHSITGVELARIPAEPACM